MGAGLSTKDAQNLFVDIMEKLILPFRERGLGQGDVAIIVQALSCGSGDTGMASTPCFQRFVKGIGPIIVQWCK